MSEHKPAQAPGAQPEVRVAIVGVGNCASSLVQGVQYYYDADATSTLPSSISESTTAIANRSAR